MTACLVITNLPDAATAEALAEHLVQTGLAACVNILAPCQSVYQWQGKLERTAEIPLLIKTTSARYAEVEAVIRARHPYELPEVIAVPIGAGLPEYLAWLHKETQS